MFRLLRIATVAGAAATTMLAGPAGAIPCPPGTHPEIVCVNHVCTVVCVPNITETAAKR